ncbi:RNA polymerase sigma factor [Desulfoscipio gibsoniae]|uniref:DNA-directed RNA polymerase specialized sigma subunit, sigma24 n=1 Tax=Desulfoscipio gibsoniae DSM 7213 TaxID=767817 RepID=R4KJS0_9FIRM|nr:sigma factor-like helix-turn-helix DNA-binding protein [Desulfoscipio gibsoniae]AGL03443.1 DNA-directed RNA polymerase specialized sigma subunit, sigma24 [Desulfoscipio gibsoniae DSM 7213]
MPKLGEMSKQGNSSEQIVNLLYNTGYRLTGSHNKTQELLTAVFNALNGNISINIALKNLCLIYRNKTTSSPGKNLPKAKSSPPAKDNSTDKIQEALLTLSPIERLVLVLREVLGLNYTEIAELTGIEKIAVTRLLNAGRWELRKQLAPLPSQRRPPEKYPIAK